MSNLDYSEINIEELASCIGVQAKHIPLLLGSFISESLGSLEQLHKAVEDKEYDKIAKIAHSIKGSAANLQLLSLSELARELELQAKEKDSDYDYLQQLEMLKKGIESFQI